MASDTSLDAGSGDAQTKIAVEHPFTEFLRMYVRNAAAVAAFFVFACIVLAAVFGPMLTDLDPFRIVWMPIAPPGQDGFLLGTDSLGRSIAVQVLFGARPPPRRLGWPAHRTAPGSRPSVLGCPVGAGSRPAPAPR